MAMSDSNRRYTAVSQESKAPAAGTTMIFPDQAADIVEVGDMLHVR